MPTRNETPVVLSTEQQMNVERMKKAGKEKITNSGADTHLQGLLWELNERTPKSTQEKSLAHNGSSKYVFPPLTSFLFLSCQNLLSKNCDSFIAQVVHVYKSILDI